MRKSANTKSGLKQRIKKHKDFADSAIKVHKKYQSMSKSKHAPTRKEGLAQQLRHLGVQKRKSKRK